MQTMQFKLDATEIGDYRLTLDGQDVSDRVQRVTIDVGSGAEHLIPKLYIEARGSGTFEGTGIVFEQLDQREAIIRWLMNLDPEKLEQEALEGLGLDGDGPATTGEGILHTLLKWAGADPIRT